MKMLKFFFIFLLIAIPFVWGGFSTPYLKDNTLILEHNETYDFEVIFQNPHNETIEMQLTVLEGKDWVDQNIIVVEVPAFNYDIKKVIKISPPRDYEYNQSYRIVYTVGAPNTGGEGMIPLTSQIKKEFDIIVPKPFEENKINIKLIMISFIIVMGSGLLLYQHIKQKKESKLENED